MLEYDQKDWRCGQCATCIVLACRRTYQAYEQMIDSDSSRIKS